MNQFTNIVKKIYILSGMIQGFEIHPWTKQRALPSWNLHSSWGRRTLDIQISDLYQMLDLHGRDNKEQDGEGGILHVMGLVEQKLFESGRVNHEDTWGKGTPGKPIIWRTFGSGPGVQGRAKRALGPDASLHHQLFSFLLSVAFIWHILWHLSDMYTLCMCLLSVFYH